MDNEYISPVVITEESEKDARVNFGDETFDQLILQFCESGYDIYLNDFNAAYQDKSFTNIKAHVHKFKTTAG